MVWGTDGGKIEKERLDKLGLYCYGGGSKKGEVSYYVYSCKDKNLELELTQKEFNNIEEYFIIYTRRKKLKKLKNEISSRRVKGF